MTQRKWTSFDAHLQALAVERGAHVMQDRVDGWSWKDSGVRIETRCGGRRDYELLAIAVGVNSAALKTLQTPIPTYKPPRTTKTFICEYRLGEETIREYLGNSMHVFLLNVPRLEFAAIIPKGDYATVCLLGEEIDRPMINSFLASPAVRRCFPSNLSMDSASCFCSPRINIHAAVQPFADRIVLIGDSGVTRLYKDGIGAAYRTAKAAAVTAAFHGVSAEDFRRHYWPICRRIDADNRIGKAIFAATRRIQKKKHEIRGILRIVSMEQSNKNHKPRMTTVLWDLFTGSAPYREIILSSFHPAFLTRWLWSLIVANLSLRRQTGL